MVVKALGDKTKGIRSTGVPMGGMMLIFAIIGALGGYLISGLSGAATGVLIGVVTGVMMLLGYVPFVGAYLYYKAALWAIPSLLIMGHMEWNIVIDVIFIIGLMVSILMTVLMSILAVLGILWLIMKVLD